MWGTTATIINSISFNIFQFTPRVGERQYLNQSTHIQTYISIHAPHIESDSSSYVAVRPFVFQFTPPYRERLSHLFHWTILGIFQFTLPCGSDPFISSILPKRKIFQFTPHTGSDIILPRRNLMLTIFQFTPPCGSDPSKYGI